jgi:hypothetical protein
MAHKHIASRALQEGQNPLDVARQLLRENTKPTTDFNRPLHYPPSGVA